MSYILSAFLALIFILPISSCGGGRSATADADNLEALRHELAEYAERIPANVGIAVITPEKDTVTVNDEGHYTLMSVFKLHQAIALCHDLDLSGVPLDTVLTLRRNELDPSTWSPMMKDHKEDIIRLPASELLRYTLQESDNNASNYLFDHMLSVRKTDSIIRALTGVVEFNLSHTESQMKENHELSKDNWSTPLACAIIIDKVYNEELLSPSKLLFLRKTLTECRTGDRLTAVFKEADGVRAGHKTGSGYRDKEGKLMAHNNIGHIMLPDGRCYSIAVLINDFEGTEKEASEAIAGISEIVFRHSNGVGN